jgi:hypothetical protein
LPYRTGLLLIGLSFPRNRRRGICSWRHRIRKD